MVKPSRAERPHKGDTSRYACLSAPHVLPCDPVRVRAARYAVNQGTPEYKKGRERAKGHSTAPLARPARKHMYDSYSRRTARLRKILRPIRARKISVSYAGRALLSGVHMVKNHA